MSNKLIVNKPFDGFNVGDILTLSTEGEYVYENTDRNDDSVRYSYISYGKKLTKHLFEDGYLIDYVKKNVESNTSENKIAIDKNLYNELSKNSITLNNLKSEINNLKSRYENRLVQINSNENGYTIGVQAEKKYICEKFIETLNYLNNIKSK